MINISSKNSENNNQYRCKVIALQQGFISSLGLEAAVLFSQAMYWQKKMGDRFWYKTQDDWKSEIGLSRRQQERARKVLREFQPCFWHEKYSGTPRRLFFKIDFSVLSGMSLLTMQASNEQADMLVTNEQVRMINSAKHISKGKQKIKEGDFVSSTSGINAFVGRHIDNREKDHE